MSAGTRGSAVGNRAGAAASRAAARHGRPPRAVSTVLDAAAFLLLVSLAVGTLHLPGGTTDRPPTRRADATAEALATGTTSVEYELTVPADPQSARGASTAPVPRAAGANATVAGNASTAGNTTVLANATTGPGDAATVRILERGNASVARTDLRADRAAGGVLGWSGGSATTSGERDRVAHGSYAGLLAEAAVENATFDGTQLSGASDDFERRVADAVLAGTNATGGRVHVRAVWTPYRGAPVRGVATAGPRLPAGTTVAAATVRVPSRFDRTRTRAVRAAERDGYDGVARVVADTTVAGWFPPDDARLALRGDHPVDALLTRRYRRTAALLGTNVSAPVGAVEPRRANRRLSAALAARLERDLRERFGSPAAAARAVRVGEVRVVVRAW